MATMIRSGLPIVDAMILVADQTKNANLKTTVQKIVDRLNGGSSLSAAFRNTAAILIRLSQHGRSR